MITVDPDDFDAAMDHRLGHRRHGWWRRLVARACRRSASQLVEGQLDRARDSSIPTNPY